MTDYYSDTTMLSNSMIGKLLEDERLFTLFMKGEHTYETTVPMNIGNIVHWNVFNEISDGDFSDEEFVLPIIDVIERRTKVSKEKITEAKALYGDSYIIKSDYDDAMRCVENVLNDNFSIDYINRLKGEYILSFEEVSINDIEGIACKGKKDITCRNMEGDICKIVDLKTTGDIKKFHYSVRTYGYDRQCAFYSKLDGLNLENDVFDFWTVDKKTGLVRLFKTNGEQFIRNANYALSYGLNKFKEWKNNDLINLNTIVL